MLCAMLSCSVMSNSLQPYARFLHPWDSPGKNTGMGCHALLQGIFPTHGWIQISHIAGEFFTIWVTREAQ